MYKYITIFRKMSRGLILFLCAFFSMNISAQDARLSQIWSLPSMMNPALIGASPEVFHATAGYSSMKSVKSAVDHQYAAFSTRYEQRTDTSIKAYGLGVSYYKYASPVSAVLNPSPFQARFFALTGSYHFALTEDSIHLFGIGGQVAVANALAKENGTYYDKNINSGGFRWTNILPNSNRTGTLGYYDINVGIFHRYKREKSVLESGLALYHLNNPKINIIGVDPESALRARLVLHNKLFLPTKNNKTLVLSNVFWREGLYWRSTAVDKYSQYENWTGVEMLNATGKTSDFHFNVGVFTRSFQTFMPQLSVFAGSGFNVRASYEVPLGVRDYDAKRMELSVHLIVANKREKKPRIKPVPVKKTEVVTPVEEKKVTVVQGDRDNDGLTDQADKCPDQAGPIGNMGCPIADRDGDGIPDVLDKCPEMEGVAENFGCPDTRMFMPKETVYNSAADYYLAMSNMSLDYKDSIRFHVYFDFNSARLTDNAFLMLNKMVNFLKLNRDFRCVVAGHADAEGTDDDNMRISQRRATMVKNFFVSYGIDAKRFDVSYFGKTRLLPQSDKSLMWMNRRAEMMLYRVR
jgi:outer membrane protein OmpA-like peptidoglycan-associated protein